jgi:flagellar biosynthesis/type III secretory pathway chaperone
MASFGKPTDALTPELSLLAQEADALSAVLHALEAEHAALLEGDAEALETAVAAKQTALSNHAQISRQRESAGLRNSITDYVRQHPKLTNGQRVTGMEIADRLRATGENCQALNQRNGRLIAGLRERTQSALTVLRAGEVGVMLYGQQGESSKDMGSRVLGTA